MSLTLTVPIFNGFKKENDFDIKKYEYEKKILDHKEMVKNFYTDYKHKKNFKTFRVDSSKIILETGKFKVVKEELILGDHHGGKKININKLKKNINLNKHSRKITIFKKLNNDKFNFKKVIL